jgi:U3 small nucleolar RNA-associated protein MPP10
MELPLDATAAADKGEASLQLLREADPALFLSPSSELAAAARAASQRIYSSLAPLSPAQPPPLPTLLAGPAFDAEQVWSQIELLARPLLPHLRRQLRRLEQQPQAALPVETPGDDDGEEQSEEDGQGSELEELKGELEETDDEEGLSDDEEEEEEEELDGRGGKGFEDRFLKIDEMAEFLDKGDEEEYGGSSNRGEKKKARENWMEESDDEGEDDYEGEDDEGEDDDDEDQLDVRISFSFSLSLSCSKMIIIFGSFRERKLNGTSGLFLRN